MRRRDPVNAASARLAGLAGGRRRAKDNDAREADYLAQTGKLTPAQARRLRKHGRRGT